MILILFVQLRTSMNQLEQSTSELLSLDNYDITTLKTDLSTKNLVLNSKNYQDLVNLLQSTQDEKKRYQTYLKSLSNPYENFLQYMYLPRLNIWKNYFTQTIDTSLVGQKYLEKNPYQDVKVIQQWSDFFKDVGKNTQFNDITSINVGDIQEDDKGFFTIPVTLSFNSPDKKSFLLLIDKLSMTSNKENISLINEFMYNLWEIIKKDKKKFFTGTMVNATDGVLVKDTNIDHILGYKLYQWAFNSGSKQIQIDNDVLSWNVFIDNMMIDKAIKITADCKNETSEICLYKFRDKYRMIPYLAYGIGLPSDDKVEALRQFLNVLPPVIAIRKFTFNKNTSQIANTYAYQGQMTLDIYGKGIANEEIDEVSKLLGKQCFLNATPLTIDYSIEIINKNLTQLTSLNKLNSDRTKDLLELKDLFVVLQKNYPKLKNSERMIKLFEAFRMLQDNNICEL